MFVPLPETTQCLFLMLLEKKRKQAHAAARGQDRSVPGVCQARARTGPHQSQMNSPAAVREQRGGVFAGGCPRQMR